MGEELQGSPAIVPKFASFKTKLSHTIRKQSSGSNAEPRESRDDREAKESDVTAISQTKPALSESQRRYRHLKGRENPRLSREDGHNVGETDIFTIDYAGDPKNLTYRSLHGSAMPQYHRSGGGKVVGYQTAKIDTGANVSKELVLSAQNGHAKGEKPKIRPSVVADQPLRRLKRSSSRRERKGSEDNTDYIPLGRRTLEDSNAQYQNGVTSLRSPSGLAKVECLSADQASIPQWPVHDVGSNAESEDSASDYEIAEPNLVDEKTQNTRAKLARTVKEDPSNCDAWLELIEHQGHMIGLDRNSSGSKIMTHAEQQSIAEVKVSMYETAIKAAVTLGAKERLVRGLMEEGTKIWHGSVVLARWHNILQQTPFSFKLWALYLNYRQTSFTQFRYEEMRALFVECLDLLQNVSKAIESNNPELNALQMIRVYLVTRLTSFTREAGFTELALAIWQALLEYTVGICPLETYKRPTSDEYANTNGLSDFRDFWESEVPRIGEEGAMGWARFHVADHEKPVSKIVASETSAMPHVDAFNAWAVLERQKTTDCRRLARVSDDVEENDPYRVILFSDIDTLLEKFTRFPPNPSHIVVGWLRFCHLPPWTNDGGFPESRQWYRDPFLQTELPYQLGNTENPSLSDCSEMQGKASGLVKNHLDVWEIQKASNIFEISLRDYELDADVLFPYDGNWFSAFGTKRCAYSKGRGPVDMEMVQRTMGMLVDARIGGDSFAEYCLALELYFAPKAAKKVAKSLIKTRHNNLRLYSVYASVLYHISDAKGAERVIAGALNNSQALRGYCEDDVLYLWRTWTWALLHQGKAKEALGHLLAYPHYGPMSRETFFEHKNISNASVQPTQLLRAQQALTAARDRCVSLGRPIHSYLACDLLILLAYLADSATLLTAVKALHANLAALGTRFPATSSAHELVYQSFARLLYHHAAHVPLFKPSVIRDSLAAGISLFPHNVILLSIFAWNEIRFRIDDRVRMIIDDVVLKPKGGRKDDLDSVMPHIFLLFTERNRHGSNSNIIRGTLERAVTGSAVAHCAGLWRLYVLYEMTLGEPRKAKAVWWRAVQACPWVKTLWMMGFEELRSGFSSEELKGLHAMMERKELRLHVDLIDFLDKKQ